MREINRANTGILMKDEIPRFMRAAVQVFEVITPRRHGLVRDVLLRRALTEQLKQEFSRTCAYVRTIIDIDESYHLRNAHHVRLSSPVAGFHLNP